MQNRRNFLKSAPMAAAFSTATANAVDGDNQDEVDYYAVKLSDALRKKYGGVWSVDKHPGAAFVMLVR